MAELLIHSSSFKHNLDTIAKALNTRDKIALVLKDNAYGHGIKEIAKLAKDYGIKNVFVKNQAEALQIANDFENITALYGQLSPDAPPNIIQTIHRLETLKTLNPTRKIELKINIGMNRNGIEPQEIEEAIALILKRGIPLIGVFSHNAYGDEGGEEMQNQHTLSQEIKAHIMHLSHTLGFPLPRFHFLSSSGALRHSHIHEDLVRIGIAAYGYASPSLPIHTQLKPIASLWAHQISKRPLKAEQKVGYSGAGQMPQDGVISTYDLGYGDGLFRLSENHQGILCCAKGERILPRMSMDCFSCLSEEEKLCVFEDVRIWADFFETIPYEILVKLSPSISRRIL